MLGGRFSPVAVYGDLSGGRPMARGTTFHKLPVTEIDVCIVSNLPQV